MRNVRRLGHNTICLPMPFDASCTMTTFVNEKLLATLLLEGAKWHEPGIVNVKVVYATSTTSTCNWRVESFDRGGADYDAAREAIRIVVSIRRDDWVMVPERDWRDGQIVGRERFCVVNWDGPEDVKQGLPEPSKERNAFRSRLFTKLFRR